MKNVLSWKCVCNIFLIRMIFFTCFFSFLFSPWSMTLWFLVFIVKFLSIISRILGNLFHIKVSSSINRCFVLIRDIVIMVGKVTAKPWGEQMLSIPSLNITPPPCEHTLLWKFHLSCGTLGNWSATQHAIGVE